MIKLSNRHATPFYIYITAVLLISCTIWSDTHAQVVQQKLPEKTRILFLLDGSGSMLASWGASNRISTAKDMLTDLVDSLRGNQNLELALRVYGHIYRKSSQNCKDTRLEVGFGKQNHDQIINKLMTIMPKGTTPIAYSLEQGAADFPLAAGYRNIVIIITDGIESCDGDPCAVSLALQKQNIFLRPFIIGIGMDRDYKKQFRCIGEYFDARDIGDFKKALSTAIETSLKLTSASVELLDEDGKPRVTNVNVTFVNAFTGKPAFNFVHYRDRNGKPDSVQLDPVINYNVVANTLPPVYKRNVKLIPGKHNVITLSTPQGRLAISQKGTSAYGNAVKAIIREASKGESIHAQDINSTQQYITGTYDIEVLTTPRRFFNNTRISQDKTTSISLPDPGILNLDNSSSGYGSLYEIMDSGEQQWVYDLSGNKGKESIALQPGQYKIVFRVADAPGSKYTGIKTVKIESGRSTTMKLFN